MKRVKIVTSNFYPEISGGANRVMSFAQTLAANGFDVHVIALDEREHEAEIAENITAHYVKKNDMSNVGFVKRAFNEIGDARKLVRKAKSVPTDHVITTVPYMFLLPVQRLGDFKSHYILDIRDLVWEYLPEGGVKGVIKKVISWVMYRSLGAYRNITVTNQYEKEVITKRVPSANVTVIYNGIDQKKFDILSSLNLQAPSQCVVTYVGNIGLAQNLITLIDAATGLEGVKVQIVGGGKQKTQLETYVQEKGIENVAFLGEKAWDELKAIYEHSTILYAQLTKDYDSAVPSKLYEYASTGLPVIYGGVGESQALVERFEGCRGIEPDHVEALQETIRALCSMSGKGHKLTANIDLIRTHFIREQQNLQILTCLQEIHEV